MATSPPYQFSLPEGSRVYMLRGTRLVPLIPADQLPYRVQGVPRELTHREMSDGNWKFSHETENTATILKLQASGSITLSQSPASSSTVLPQSPVSSSIVSPKSPAPSSIVLPKCSVPSKPRFLAPDHRVRSESCNVDFDAPSPSSAEKVSGHGLVAETATLDPSISLADTFSSIYPKDAQRFNYRTVYPSGMEPDQSKKEYCTYWIKNGECAYMSYNCKFKHEMPTMMKLRELGFTRQPRWWREKSAIGVRSPTWMEQRSAWRNANGDSPGEMQPLREFPDPSTFRNNPRSTRPPAPIPEVAGRRDSQTSNLIDLDEDPAPPPSPRLVQRSLSIVSTSDNTTSSNSTSNSPSASPAVERPVTKVTGTAGRSANTAKKAKEEQPVATIATHGKARASRDSEVEDTVPVKSASASESASRDRHVRLPKKSTKNTGLADSKHAASSKEKAPVTETETEDRNRKMPRPEEKTIPTGPRADHVSDRRVLPKKGRASKGTNGEQKAMHSAIKKISDSPHAGCGAVAELPR
jgi:hypothetical protein